MGYCPEEQQYRASREQRRHEIDTVGHLRDVASGEIHEKAAGEHEYRVARRVTDFEFECLKYEFRTIPETGRRLKRQDVGQGGHHKA